MEKILEPDNSDLQSALSKAHRPSDEEGLSQHLPRSIKIKISLNKVPNLLQTPIKNINHHLKSDALRMMIISNSPRLIT